MRASGRLAAVPITKETDIDNSTCQDHQWTHHSLLPQSTAANFGAWQEVQSEKDPKFKPQQTKAPPRDKYNPKAEVMSESPPPDRPKIKKRKYSRKGCNECKRRKIKCDEGEPECHNCSRLRKKCCYSGEKPTGPHSPGEGKAAAAGGDSAFTIRFYEPKPAGSAFPGAGNGISNHTDAQKPLQTAENDAYRTKQEPAYHEWPAGEYPQHTGAFLPSLIDIKNLYNEASLLVHGINHSLVPEPLDVATAMAMVSSVTPTANSRGESLVALDEKFHFNQDEFDALEQLHTLSPDTAIGDHLLLSNSELIHQCMLGNQLEEPHVHYLRTLTTTDLLYHLFPFASLIESNEVVKLLLTYLVKCSYLLSSLLAISATFQFNQTGRKCHDSARQKYTVLCFKALSDAFTATAGFLNAAVLASNIENLLLTVLVLLSYFTATALGSDADSNSWMAHLKGARDLLLKYSRSVKDLRGYDHPRFMLSGLALAKSWFFAIEASAALHTSEGAQWGSSHDESSKADSADLESDLFASAPTPIYDARHEMYLDTGFIDMAVNPDYHIALQRVNLICQSQSNSFFCLFWGFGLGLVKSLVAFVSSMEAVKLRKLPQVPLRWTMHVAALLDQCVHDVTVPRVSLKSFRIPENSVGHPNYRGVDRLVVPASCYAEDFDEEGAVQYYSWFDASHQLHVDYLNLRMLLSEYFLGLRRSHPAVQYLLKKILGGAFFIKSKALPSYEREKSLLVVESDNFYLSQKVFDNRCIMVQLVFRLVAGIVVEEQEFEMIELYFMGLVKLGNGSSLLFLDVLAKYKETRAANSEKLNGEIDEEVFYYYESTDAIPFA